MVLSSGITDEACVLNDSTNEIDYADGPPLNIQFLFRKHAVQAQLSRIAQESNLRNMDVVVGNPQQTQHYRYRHPPSSANSAADHGRYLIASITKPIVAMATLKLASEGELTLAARMGDLLPPFRKAGFRKITVRHLLTHTSGFPDMLPDNTELRAARAPLNRFIEGAAAVGLDFTPGSDCRYSSIGFLLLGAITEKLTGTPLAAFLRDSFFRPLGMNESWLGLPASEADDLMPTVLPCELPAWQPNADDWGWNSEYWRTLGAPWGGMVSTASDLALFLGMMLSRGAGRDGTQILPEKVVGAAMADQLNPVAREPTFQGPVRGWGFGWRRQWPGHFASFGDFVSAETVGHWGATGTLAWVDPDSDRYAVILTTTPYEQSQAAVQQISNLAAVADERQNHSGP